MKPKEPIESENMGRTIVRRSGVGPNDLIAGWQSVLSRMLKQMQPFLQPARIITFQRIHAYEQGVFRQIIQGVGLVGLGIFCFTPEI